MPIINKLKCNFCHKTIRSNQSLQKCTMCFFNVHVRCSDTQRKNSKSQNVSQHLVCRSCISENFSFPFVDCTDFEFAEITDVNIDDDYTKFFKTVTLNATELNLIYSNKIHRDMKLTFNNDTNQEDGLQSQSTGCVQYIPSKVAHIILCDKECSYNNCIA